MRSSVLVVLVIIALIERCVAQKNPHFVNNRTTIVQLFEWKWKDIANECESFLQNKGYGGVQISPPNENIIVANRPWWERYQPLSYQLKTRSGDEADFLDMTKRCNAVGIRIYADAVINHMAASSGQGTGGNEAKDDGYTYPAVPYNKEHFHSSCAINNYNDPAEIRNCQLVGLRDLNQEVTLPKLPVPPLEQTMEKYEHTMKSLLVEEEQIKLRHLIEKFSGPDSLGKQLQLYLLERQQKMENWAYNYWLDDMYMKNPIALPVNSNPGMVFPPRKFTTILDVARFTARLLDAALEHKSILDRGLLPMERATSREPGQPLCMAQYYRILGSCRIPGKIKDSQYITPKPQPGEHLTEHVIVICRSQLYCVPVQAPDRGRLNEDEICAQLLHILDDAPCLASPPPVGILTGWKRSLWAEVRDNLLKDERNRRNLDLIAKSLLVVCLDEGLSSSFNCRLQRGSKGHSAGHRDETNLAAQMIHGGGSTFDSGNRWFDKTIQLIISGDGACGLCYEHSQAEGIAVIQLVEKLWKHADSQPVVSEVPATSGYLPPPERLEWILEADDFNKLEAAALDVDNLVKDLDFQVFRYPNYGKNFIKACKVSPDVYIQLALQLAYYKLYGKLTATYESASTRRFRLGRVDCIRSAHPEALAWVSAMAQPREDDEMGKKVTFHLVSDEEKMRLWRDATKRQTSEMIENILGQGIDIHLLGLREAARETTPLATSPLPDLFADVTYKLANKFLLSTSQVATSSDSFMGYGPVEPDGYGASYNPKPDCIVFCLSAFWSSEVTSTSRFAQALEESLNSMQSLLTRPTT